MPTKEKMLKKSLTPCLFFLACQGVTAQTLPSAAGQMQQIPPIPSLPGNLSSLEVQSRAPTQPLPAQATVVVVKHLRVTGAAAYTESELVKVAQFEPERAVTLSALYAMADRITQRYRRDGYLVARAYLPPQEIQDGVVTIAVLEGQYGQLSLKNTSVLDDQVPRDLMVGLNFGEAIQAQPLEERLLLLSDLPGVQIRSTLVPGAAVGLSDLIVEVQPDARISGSVDADNAGNRYTGENRLGATVHLNNVTGQGDLGTLRALTSGRGLQYLRAAYQAPVGRGRLGVSYSDLGYKLGHEFKDLDANGHARIATLFGSYPVIRSRQTNLNVGLTLDSKAFQDRLKDMDANTDKRAQVATVSMYGDHRDALGGGGLSNYSLAWSTGNLDIQTSAARIQDAARAGTDGRYNKLAFAVSRLQQTSPSISFLASLSGQVASKNLDVSEKMELGGMYGVRAYPEGEAYADEGYLITLEARKQLVLPSEVAGQLHLAAFVDAGSVKLNHSAWTAENQQRHLSAAGLAVYWTQTRNFSVKAYYARKLGKEQASSAPDKSGRFWVQAVKYF